MLSACAGSQYGQDDFFNKDDFNDEQYKKDSAACAQKAKKNDGSTSFFRYQKPPSLLGVLVLEGAVGFLNSHSLKEAQASALAECMKNKGYKMEFVDAVERNRRLSLIEPQKVKSEKLKKSIANSELMQEAEASVGSINIRRNK